MKKTKDLRTWIEVDKKALEHNFKELLKLIPKHTYFMAVVKSNAYGHGLAQVAKLIAEDRTKNLESRSASINSKFQILNSRLWFGVDSIVEALRLRREGIKNHILVLGSTLPSRMREAAEENIVLTVSNFDALTSLIRTNKRIVFHLKIDTGMHRQGFLPQDTLKLIKLLKRFKLAPQGIYTHFSAKDWGYPAYTERQFSEFKKVLALFERSGFKNLIRHAAASDATLLFPGARLGMVRVGMLLYGYWSSWVAKVKHPADLEIKPVLSWKTMVSEVKKIPRDSYVGYDLTEKVAKDTKIAILPIGYWHGYDRGLSSAGEVLIRGRRRKILGRVSMDMIVVDVTDRPLVGVGDEAVLIGRQGREAVWADELALKSQTSHYEFLTRINPLIRRVVK